MELDQRLADIDRQHVGGAKDGERGEAQRHRVRQAKHDRRGAEDDHRGEHLDPDVVLQRVHREPHRHRRRTDRGGGAEVAEPLGPGVEDVARIDRKHGGRPAEEHREQVEADRAEHERVAADVAQPVDRLRPRAGGAVDQRARDRRDPHQPEQGNREQGRAHFIRRLR